MRLKPADAVLGLGLAALALAACGKIFISFNPSSGSSGNVIINLTLRDTPPADVTVLAAELTISGAAGVPGNVPLLPVPVRVELGKLETETAFLGTAVIRPGSLSGLNLTLANPQIAILNGSGATVAGCANGAVCELRPRLTSSSVFLPFALVADASRPVALVLDFDLTRSLSADLTIAPTFRLTEIVPLLATDPLEDVNDFVGQVTSVGANQFTLNSASAGLTLTAQVDGATRFAAFAPAGLPDGLAGVRAGQILAADLRLLLNGTLLARRVTLEDAAGVPEVEGVVVAADPPSRQFTLVVHDAVPEITGVAAGNRVTVNVQPAAAFDIDAGGLTLPPGAAFNSAADLLVGQQVQARVRVVASDVAEISIASDRVRLRLGQLTARVAAKSGNGLTLTGLPGLFVSAGITTIQVPASLDTSFENAAGFAALVPGDIVSLRGLLFANSPAPTLAARRIRRR